MTASKECSEPGMNVLYMGYISTLTQPLLSQLATHLDSIQKLGIVLLQLPAERSPLISGTKK